MIARDLTVTVDAAPAVVRGDPALLARLVGNLVENAVRHNVPAGWIRIRTGSDGAAGVLEVGSAGPVIDPEAIAQLFEPFRQGQRARTGQRGHRPGAVDRAGRGGRARAARWVLSRCRAAGCW